VRDRPLSRVTDVRQLSFIVAYDYSVAFTRDAFSPDDCCVIEALARREPDKRHRCAIFIDEGVLAAMPGLPQRITDYAAAHRQNIEVVGAAAIVVGGENCKNNPETTPRLLEVLSKHAIDRHSFAIAIGGGAVLHAVGYAAAIFHRGVRHIRFPTTVLAQDDSGVGVKNAVNALWHDALNHRNAQGRLAVLQGLADFQEHLGGELTITLLAGIGRGVEVHEMDTRIVEQCIDWLEQRG
jgi:3-dehydroquinate synthase